MLRGAASRIAGAGGALALAVLPPRPAAEPATACCAPRGARSALHLQRQPHHRDYVIAASSSCVGRPCRRQLEEDLAARHLSIFSSVPVFTSGRQQRPRLGDQGDARARPYRRSPTRDRRLSRARVALDLLGRDQPERQRAAVGSAGKMKFSTVDRGNTSAGGHLCDSRLDELNGFREKSNEITPGQHYSAARALRASRLSRMSSDVDGKRVERQPRRLVRLAWRATTPDSYGGRCALAERGPVCARRLLPATRLLERRLDCASISGSGAHARAGALLSLQSARSAGHPVYCSTHGRANSIRGYDPIGWARSSTQEPVHLTFEYGFRAPDPRVSPLQVDHQLASTCGVLDTTG